MARRALAASFVVSPFLLALAAQGCTQDFGTFDPTGSGGTGPTTSSSSTGSPTTTTGGTGGSTTTTTVGTGGTGQGGGGAPPTDCTLPGDCEDDNRCTTDSCEDGTCVFTPVADGPLDGDDPTDCVDLSCVGGEETSTPDDTEDPPDVSPPCDIANCVEGVPTQVLAPEGTSCGQNPQACDGAGLCVGCDGSPANECGDPTACSAPSCDVGTMTCQSNFTTDDPPDPTDGDCKNLDCPGGQADANVVNDDTDVPDDTACSDRGCNNGNPTTPVRAEGLACLAGQTGVCDGAGTGNSACRDCRDTANGAATDAGCSAGAPLCNEAANGGEGVCRVCNDDQAGTGQDTGCAANQLCNPAGIGTCTNCVDGGNGVVDLGCTAPLLACNSGTCVECRNDADCDISGMEAPNGALCNRADTTQCGCSMAGGGAACDDAPNGPECSGNGGTCGCSSDGQCATSRQGDACLAAAPRKCGCVDGTDCMGTDAAGPNCNAGVCGN